MRCRSRVRRGLQVTGSDPVGSFSAPAVQQHLNFVVVWRRWFPTCAISVTPTEFRLHSTHERREQMPVTRMRDLTCDASPSPGPGAGGGWAGSALAAVLWRGRACKNSQSLCI